MDIRATNAPAPMPSVSPTARPGEANNQAQREKRVPPAARSQTDNKAGNERRQDAPKTPHVRVELRIDDATNQVFGRVIDSNTGQEIREIPAKDVRRLQAISREMFGSMLDKKV